MQEFLTASALGKATEYIGDEHARACGTELSLADARVAGEILPPVDHDGFFRCMGLSFTCLRAPLASPGGHGCS